MQTQDWGRAQALFAPGLQLRLDGIPGGMAPTFGFMEKNRGMRERLEARAFLGRGQG